MASIKLTRGLTDEQVEQLDREIKHSVLARQLRKYLQKEIANSELREEQLYSQGIAELAAQVGGRRELRTVLNLIPEEKS